MRKYLCLLMALATLSVQALAQNEPAEEGKKKLDPDRLVFGGNMGATFGDFTFIQASPQVGYRFSDFFTAGAGINFISATEKFRNFQGNEVYRTNNGYAGLNLFARVFPVRFLMASLQPELNYNWGKIRFKDGVTPTQRLDGAFIPSLLVGGGVLVPTGGRGGMLISLQYDVMQNSRSPYGRRAFVNFGYTF